jgi:8-oxo-dGTP pyrophosphatase MutT (NUDIX family)
MYKVFFNESFLIISEKAENNNGIKQIVLPLQNIRQLEVWLAEAESSTKPANMIFIHKQPELIWEKFKANFKIIKAAGGLVKNNSDQYLFIFRKGKWDLPKGKIDKGETTEDGAIREIQEETGIQTISIQNKLTTTYHIYRLKGKLVLKETFWYVVQNHGNETLIPQAEEDIEKAVWLSKNEIGLVLANTYGSVKDVILISSIF